MESRNLNLIQKLFKMGKVLSKIAFIFSMIGFVGSIAGLVGLGFGGELIKIGGVTLHGLIANSSGYAPGAIAAALSGWLIVCAGEGVLAKFAQAYFEHEGQAGTPFTPAGAKELMRLGILTMAIPIGCTVIGSIAEGMVAGFLQVEKAAMLDFGFDNGARIVLGVMLLVISLLCRYGAELAQKESANEQ